MTRAVVKNRVTINLIHSKSTKPMLQCILESIRLTFNAKVKWKKVKIYNICTGVQGLV